MPITIQDAGATPVLIKACPITIYGANSTQVLIKAWARVRTFPVGWVRERGRPADPL